MLRDPPIDTTRQPARSVPSGFRERLAAKNRHNIMIMALFLLTRWLQVHVMMLIGIGAVTFDAEFGAAAIAVGIVAAAAFTIGYSVLIERAATAFRPLRPQFCSIYDPYFWWHERYWKLSTQPAVLNGTPFKSLVWRLLGVRIGKRAFDDGCGITEKTLVHIGDDCTLSAGSILQAHSMEDGIFKADYITIGSHCTVGIGAFVHYGAIIDDAVISTDAFVMKGERVAAATRWSGNPARPTSKTAIPAAAQQHRVTQRLPAAPHDRRIDRAVMRPIPLACPGDRAS